MGQNASHGDPKFPLPEATYLTSVKRLLAARGQAKAAELLSVARSTVSYGGYERVCDGGSHYWDLLVTVSIEQYASIAAKELKQVEEAVRQAARDFFRGSPDHGVGNVTIAPAMVAHLTMVEKVNNQGNGVPGKPAHIPYDDLKFRSRAEVRLYKALAKRKGVLVAPGPVFVVDGSAHREPDFFLLYKGLKMLVEVDGPDTHRETPVEAERRLAAFHDQGVIIARVSTAECDGDADAEKCADRLLAKFEAARETVR